MTTAQSEKAWTRFRNYVESLGWEVVATEWLGSTKPHAVRCTKGHVTHPLPGAMQSQRQTNCNVCYGRGGAARDRFYARVAELGGTVLESKWHGVNNNHLVRCPVGHEHRIRPSSVRIGRGICRACAGHSPAQAELDFLARLVAMNCTPTYDKWLGARHQHDVLCPEGHECRPCPNDVQQGQGVCKVCAGKVWDAFYVVYNPDTDVLKFGITSGDPHSRVRHHVGKGYIEVLRTFRDLPADEAKGLEDELMNLMRCADVAPVQGREYFSGATLNVILGTVDAWFAASGASGAVV